MASGCSTDVQPSAPKRKNAHGSRTDIAWKHGVAVDEKNCKKIKCKYCETVITGGAFRFKHHLAWSSPNVRGCPSVSPELKEEMRCIILNMEEKKVEKRKIEESFGGGASILNELTSGSSDNMLRTVKGKTSQTTINKIFKKEIQEDASRAVARFFYNNAIPFNVAKSDEFKEMCDLIARHGQGFVPPSYHQIRVKYLKEEVKLTAESLEDHKKEWVTTGCSIMTDGWTDKRRRTIINFLVNSPKGTVFLKSIDASHITKSAEKIFEMIDAIVEEVGEENVVQVVTDNAANYKAAGEMLMEKRKTLYWTPCAAHCIDLMLEDFEKKIPTHQETISRGRKITSFIYSRTSLISLLQKETKGKELIRPGITRFATSYLSLGSLHDNKGSLIRMFTSEAWKNNRSSKISDGKYVEEVVMDKVFWKNVVICLKGAIPLIKVLRLVDSDTPSMGFIYEAMDQAKESIQAAFKGVKRSYQPLWDIIDDRWDRQLHRPLHAAGYFLNPELHYSDKFKCDLEVKRGLLDCLTRLVPNEEIQTKIDCQIDDFKRKMGMFGTKIAKNGLGKKTPADWWEQYGDECKELKEFAIRVLNLTCSSSGCERNWSAFEMVHTKKRNRLKQQTMNDVIYVMTNSKLAKKKRAKRSSIEITIDDLDSDDEWIMGNENDEEALHDQNLDDEEQVQEVAIGGFTGSSHSQVQDNVDPDMPMFDDLDEDEDENEMEDDNSFFDYHDILG